MLCSTGLLDLRKNYDKKLDFCFNIIMGGDVEFDIQKGTCYVWCCMSLVSYCICLPCCCVAQKFMSTQEVNLDERRLQYKFDCWLFKTDKWVPYDRIQDVNISQNCVERCIGVSSVSIQTAGGGESPEVTIVAPMNPQMVRDRIITKRDAVVHGRSDGTSGPAHETSPLLTSSQQLDKTNETLDRIEKLIEIGLQKMEQQR